MVEEAPSIAHPNDLLLFAVAVCAVLSRELDPEHYLITAAFASNQGLGTLNVRAVL
jgi:hypothetical protein